jgi:flagellar biosynthetic protein FliO
MSTSQPPDATTHPTQAASMGSSGIAPDAVGTITTSTQAQTMTASPAHTDHALFTSPLSGVLGSALALVFVLALAWLFLKLLHRASTLRSGQASTPLQIVQSLALGGRERVLVVRSGEHEYLLGVTPSQVQLLDKRPNPAAHATSLPSRHAAPAAE